MIGLPIGVFLTFSPKISLGLWGLWIGVTISLLYCACIGTWICMRTDWNEEVGKVRERLARERRLIGIVLSAEPDSVSETEEE
jgi:MATE family multidrug resistance protein